MVAALKRRSLKVAVGHVSNGARALDRGAVASWPSESRNARRASEFLRAIFTVARGAVAGDSVSDPVGIGGSAAHGAGRGGDIDKRWPLPNAHAIENVPTCWGFELVVATLYKLLDVLVRFDATCRLEMILGNFFCDCEEVPLGERSGSCEGNALFCHGCGREKWIRFIRRRGARKGGGLARPAPRIACVIRRIEQESGIE